MVWWSIVKTENAMERVVHGEPIKKYVFYCPNCDLKSKRFVKSTCFQLRYQMVCQQKMLQSAGAVQKESPAEAPWK